MGALLSSELINLKFLRIILLYEKDDRVSDILKWCEAIPSLDVMEVYKQKPYNPIKNENPKIKLIWFKTMAPMVTLKD